MQRACIALIEDEADLREALAEYLSDMGHDVHTAGTAAEGDRIIERHRVDLIVLDLGLPGESGLDLLKRLRDTHGIAVLVMTGNRDPTDRIIGLEIGADDFVVKPVDPQELAARIGGILRRRRLDERDLLRLERSTVDLAASRMLKFGLAPERLGPGEVVLIRAFMQNPNKVLSRDDLIGMAPADSRDANDRSIDTRVARLRRKLDTNAIVTVRGQGYMYVPPFDKGSGPRG